MNSQPHDMNRVRSGKTPWSIEMHVYYASCKAPVVIFKRNT